MASSLQELRARLAAIKAAKSSAPAPAPEVPAITLDISPDYESQIWNLTLACFAYINDRSLYENYMERANSIFDLLCSETSFLLGYCTARYPDVCGCGHWTPGGDSVLRRHCVVCRGHYTSSKGYEIQRLSMHTGISESWLEYGFAWALYLNSRRMHNVRSRPATG